MSLVMPTVNWTNVHLNDGSDYALPRTMDHSVPESFRPSSSISATPHQETRCVFFDGQPSNEISLPPNLPYDRIDFGGNLFQAQALFALQLQRQQQQLQDKQQSLRSATMMLHHLPSPVSLVNPPTYPQFMTVPVSLSTISPLSVPVSQVGGLQDRPQVSARDSLERDEPSGAGLPQLSRSAKRKRSELFSSESKYDDSLDDDESSDSLNNNDKAEWNNSRESDGMPSKLKKLKLGQSAEPLNNPSDTLLSDITELLSLPQKEAAQKLGISESMLCKRFKECTRRKWPYRYLRKIEKTIASLEALQETEPLSPEDQERLQDLLKQKVECLAPVKIRITKSPSPSTPLSRSGNLTPNDFDAHSDSEDPSDVTEEDYEIEAVEKLIGFMRAGSPRSGFALPQAAF